MLNKRIWALLMPFGIGLLILLCLFQFTYETSERVVLIGPNEPVYKMIISGSAVDQIKIELERRPHLVNRYSVRGDSLLVVAVSSGRLDVVNLLLSLGADIEGDRASVVAGEGYTPLYAAVSCENIEMVKLLLEHGANPQFDRGQWGSHVNIPRATAYDIALQLKNEEIIELLNKYKIGKGDITAPSKTSR